ncbi:MAG TPA: copper ion binding protein, partial [Erysipelothrix sp.]|nr:copper ion binding protein [Erysipelothrix sp.]
MRKGIFEIEGMTCASCVASVENTLRKLEGVDSVSVNLMTNTASINMDDSLSDEAIIEAVSNGGYVAHKQSKEKFKKIDLDIEGMTCSSCSASVENGLKDIVGID